MRLNIIYLFLITGLLIGFRSSAQVTSASMAGYVKDKTDKTFIGALVRAIHQPSGTVYGTDIKDDGTFYLQGMRVGGPYKVTITFGTQQVWADSNITLQLGETYQEIIGKMATRELEGVSVIAARDNIFNNQHTGASTIITQEEINTTPNISRNALDFIGLTPEANGTQLEGRNNLYNNLQVNGANFNNSFGLSSGFSGGGMPIPLDAIQQIQVAISDFDVRENGFTGGNINMVTKSGTNTFQGDAYTYYRNQNFNGTQVGTASLPPATKLTNNIYGASLGGAIIKNKLFFYVSGEYQQTVQPALSPEWEANGQGATGANVTAVSADSLQELSSYVKNKYGYNTGSFAGAPGFNNTFVSKYTRLFARLDYNVNDKNKIDVSFNHYGDALPETANSTSAPVVKNGNARNGQNAVAFSNTDYNLVDKVNAFSAEWLSTFSSNVTNQVLCTYNQTRDTRSSPSSEFPFMDINYSPTAASNQNYTSLGYELFTYKNDVQQNALTLYDNVTIHAGINNITAGIDYQYLTFANSYLPYGTSYYRFSSINAFMNNEAPTVFAYSYPYQGSDGYSRMHYGLPGVYVQDRISLFNNKLTLNGGIRADLPLYLNALKDNKYIDTLNLDNPHSSYNNGYGTAWTTTHYNSGKWPTEQVVISPRFGFNWSPLDNGKLHVRGGSGIFLGQIPFVWFTNAPANSGTVSNNVAINEGNLLNSLKFQPTPAQAIAELSQANQNLYFSKQAGATVPGTVALIDPNFHMPKVSRSDLSADYKLPWLGMIATAEFMYTKDIYDVYEFNANMPNPTGRLADSNDHRPIYPGDLKYAFITGGAYVLSNSTPGYSYSGTFGIRIPAKKGFYASFYYTRMYSAEASAVPGSQASSAWQDLDHLNTPNENILAPSAFFAPNRYLGTLSYRLEYAKHFASTISLYYSGSNGGHFDATYYDDINGDGIFGQLIYIPQNADNLNWVPVVTRGAFSTDTIFTVAQEKAAFNQLLNSDKYLNSHRGQYFQRNGETYPFYGTLNLKFVQDFISNIGKNKNSLQFTLDILNFGNLLNRSWGIQKELSVSYDNILYGSTNTKGVTSYYMPTVTKTNAQGNTIEYNAQGIAPDGTKGTPNAPELFLPTSTFINEVSTSSVWSMQLGLKYNFR